jgi:hypothetical protein
MSLNIGGLVQGLTDLATNPPATPDQCGARWGNIMTTYASTVLPPSLGVSAAATALQGSLTSAFAAIEGALPLIETAFAAFAAAVAVGMLSPPVVATAVPPPVPVGFATLFVPPYPPTSEAGAQAVATLINLWMVKGTAVSGSGVTTIWS